MRRALWRSAAHFGKTLIFTGLLFVICTMVLTGLLIQSAAARAAAQAKASVGAVATMQLDLNAYLESGQGTRSNGAMPGTIGAGANLYSGWADKIGQAGIASEYNYQLESAAEPVNGTKPFNAVPPPPDNQDPFPNLLIANGVRDSRLLGDFRDGRAKLLEGNALTPGTTGNQALIEERFAKANELKTGSKFWLQTGELGVEKKVQLEFTVAGVYRNEAASNPSRYTPPMNEPGNNIYLTVAGASQINGVVPGPDGSRIQRATFTLADPDDLAALERAARDAGVDGKVFPLSLNKKQYEDLVGPITNTAGFAKLAVWLIAGAGVVILSLLMASAARDRRSELGILMSIGEPKPKLIGQILVEVFACAIVAIGLASVTAQIVAQDVGSTLLSKEVAAIQVQPDYSSVPGTGVDKKTDRPIDSIGVALRAADVISVGALGLGIVTLSIVLPCMAILRLRPRDILARSN